MSIIINELLCYVLNKIDLLPTDTLVRLILENFKEAEIERAKALINDNVEETIRAGHRRGQNRVKLNVDDIVKMVAQCNRENLPKFVALNLSQLPPISIDCIDVSELMRKQSLMSMEMCNMKETLDQVLKITAENSRSIELTKNQVPIRPEAQVGVSSETSVKRRHDIPVIEDSAKTSKSGKTPSTTSTTCKEPTPSRKPGGDDDNSGTGAATYASVAAGADNDWTLVEKRKKKTREPTSKTPIILGKGKASPLTAVRSAKRFSLFVSRLAPDTNPTLLEEHVKIQLGAKDVTSVRLDTKFDTYASFRVDILDPVEHNILAPDLWGEGLIVRRFFMKRSEKVSNDRTSTVQHNVI